MPGKRRHIAKWDRCIRDVKRSSSAANPYAVCTRTLGKGVRHSKRASNPLPRAGQVELVATWRDAQGRERSLLKRFDTLEEARTKARRFVIAMTRATGRSPRTSIVRRVPFNP